MRVVFFGTYDARRHPRVRVLREGLEARGLEVLECNEPWGLDTAARVEVLRAPWRALSALVRLLAAWRRLRRRARALPSPDVVVAGYLGHLDVHLARRLWPEAAIALDHLVSLRDTAVDRGSERRWLLRALGWLDARALRAADLVLVDTEEHRDALPPRVRRRAVVVPVGAPESWFSATPAAGEGSGLRVVWFGLFTPLQGAPVIGRAAGVLAGEPVSFTMIGSGQDEAAARAAAAGNDRVRWLGWVDPEELPAIVAAHDVCLGIFGAGDKGRRVVPNKVFQGAAAGCAIVTSDTAPQRRALGDAALYVPPGDPDALVGALRSLVAEPDRLKALREAAVARARAFTPAAVTEPLLAPLEHPTRSHGITATSDPPLTPNAWLRHDIIARALREMGDVRSVLEVGAGMGAMGVRLARAYDYVGLEPDPESFAVARARIADARLGEVICGDVSALPPDRLFDVVCAFEVLEHIPDDVGALKAWRARLRPGGWVLLSVPAWQRRFGAADTAAGHVRRYDPAVIHRVLSEGGFTGVILRAYGLPLGYVLEAGRNLLARRAQASEIVEATAGSGRWHQPPASFGWVTRAGTKPFRGLQSPAERTGRGTGWVVVACSHD